MAGFGRVGGGVQSSQGRWRQEQRKIKPIEEDEDFLDDLENLDAELADEDFDSDDDLDDDQE